MEKGILLAAWATLCTPHGAEKFLPGRDISAAMVAGRRRGRERSIAGREQYLEDGIDTAVGGSAMMVTTLTTTTTTEATWEDQRRNKNDKLIGCVSVSGFRQK